MKKALFAMAKFLNSKRAVEFDFQDGRLGEFFQVLSRFGVRRVIMHVSGMRVNGELAWDCAVVVEALLGNRKMARLTRERAVRTILAPLDADGEFDLVNMRLLYGPVEETMRLLLGVVPRAKVMVRDMKGEIWTDKSFRGKFALEHI